MTRTVKHRPLIREGNSVDLAQRELRSRIGRGLLLPGEQIRQEEMAEEFGLSRVPLREALNILADQGLLDHHLNRGYFVARRVPEELYQMHRMLEFLERELARSMEWPSAAQIDSLQAMNAAMAALVERADWTEIIPLNRDFHFVVFALSHYKLILREVERLWTMTDVYIAGKLALPEARRRTIAEHAGIVDALAAHDHAAFMRALDAHRSSSAPDTRKGAAGKGVGGLAAPRPRRVGSLRRG
jgi:DNA-binding GntR family transcriptional regulator